MTAVIGFGVLLAFGLTLFCLARWWNVRCIGISPAPLITFSAILFTSGLDVGLIMLPLTEFPLYADVATHPEYAFANPLAIEFGFWGFLIWAFYFLTTFYFCVVEPRVRFFEIGSVKIVHNAVVIGTCAFTAYLLLENLPWYARLAWDVGTENAGADRIAPGWFVAVVFGVIAAAAFSSTDIRYVRRLSLASVTLFGALILLLAFAARISPADLVGTQLLLADYFGNLHRFLLPLNEHHEFYLFWWFAWSIMIGQFTSRFVGGLATWQVFAALLVIPSVPLALWFGVLYHYHQHAIDVSGFVGVAMIVVGVVFVVNSLDSLIRLYTDNLGIDSSRFGRPAHVAGNVALLFGLTLLFQFDFLRIQWVGALVIALYVACLVYALRRRHALPGNGSVGSRDPGMGHG